MDKKRFGLGERAPWNNFPNIIRNGELKSLSNEKEYISAKSGDSLNALILVNRLLTLDTVQESERLINNSGYDDVFITPVLAVESAGYNKIPLATAQILSFNLNLPIAENILQREKIHRTGAGSDYRLVFNPTFNGIILPNTGYFLVDDTLAMGGTLASLRGYIENRGGHVIGAMVMTAHIGSLELPIKQSMYNAIINKHGNQLNEFWIEEFGYGIEQLTQAEAGHLRAAKTFDEIRTRIIIARNEGLSSLNARTDDSSTKKIKSDDKYKE